MNGSSGPFPLVNARRSFWSALLMTQSEMACCKKMAGDCRMGAEQHPCCKTVSSAPSPVASLQSEIHFQPVARIGWSCHSSRSDIYLAS